MITINETPKGLEIVPDDLAELAECTDLWEVFNHYLCNGWEFIPPELVGALTDGTIITQEGEQDDDGNYTKIGRVYWDSAYQVQSTLEELQAGRTVIWVGHD